MSSRIKGGCRRRPPFLILASVAFAGLVAAGPIAASPSVTKADQQVVRLLRSHNVWSAPTVWSKSRGLVPATTPLTDEQTALPVIGHHGIWLEVRLPGRPNGHSGWIRRTATIRFVTAWHIVVDLSTRQVVVYRSGRVVKTFSAVVGKPSTPTPSGEFFIEETIALTAQDVGAPYALALSARSNVLQEFDGGPGQIAIHGLTTVGGVLGTAASHGCIRLANDAMRWLAARLDPGDPVTIRR